MSPSLKLSSTPPMLLLKWLCAFLHRPHHSPKDMKKEWGGAACPVPLPPIPLLGTTGTELAVTPSGSALAPARCEERSKLLALANHPLVKRAKGLRSFLEGSSWKEPESDVCALSTESWQRSTLTLTVA